MNSGPFNQLENVIDQIMLEESEPKHAVLMRWVARYPEHRDGLVRFFATWAVQAKSNEAVAVDEDLAGSRMVSKALNFLYQQSLPSPACSGSATPQRLCRAIKSHGLTEQEVRERCQIDDSLLAKLDLRRINVGSIPRKLHQLLADVLRRPLDDVRRLLAGDPVPAAANRSRSKPAIKTEDFLDAVRTSDLTNDLKAAWAAAVAAEAKTRADS